MSTVWSEEEEFCEVPLIEVRCLPCGRIILFILAMDIPGVCQPALLRMRRNTGVMYIQVLVSYGGVGLFSGKI